MSVFLCLLMASLTRPALAADATQPQQESPALAQLKTAADTGMAPVADGSKASSDGTIVVSTQKNILLETSRIPASRRCEFDDGGVDAGSPHAHPRRTCENDPAHTVTKYGDRETIKIVDRDAYVKHQGGKWAGWGALIGGLVGALAFLGLLIPGVNVGVAVGIGIAATAVGAGVGALIGNRVAVGNAEDDPDTFTRDKVKKEEVSYP